MVKAMGWGMLAGLWLVSTTSVAQAAQAEEFFLTREGKPLAVIVTAEEPTAVAAFAAAELQYHLRQITGTVLPIVTEGTKVTGSRILVGRSKTAQEILRHTESFKSQEYLIRFLPGTLVLLGTETADGETSSRLPKRVAGRFGRALEFDSKGRRLTLPDCGFDDERGTMEAWVWLPAAKPKTHGTILRLDSGEPWTYHILQRDMNSSRISYTVYDGKEGHGVTSGGLAEGWHHVFGTHDARAGKMELFVDGIQVGSAAYVKTACKEAVLGIGGIVADPDAAVGNPFEGLIDEIRISNVVRQIKESAGGPYRPDEQTTLLLHCDEQNGPPRNSITRLSSVPPPGLFGENGTLYAVYDFLEHCCGVRWYAPGQIGLVCPRTPTLVVHGIEIRRAPAMLHRWITPSPLYLPGPPQKVPERDVQLWKLRMRIGGKNFWVCHSFYGYYDRFLKSHPDWFAQGYSGQPPQMCYTHPGLIQQVVQDARDYFDGKGIRSGATAVGDVFGLVPMDNMSWCKCPRCQAELNRAEEKNQQFNNGKASDYIFGFVNKVACEVRKTVRRQLLFP